MGYLDNSGLTNLWKKITDKFTAVNNAINNKLDKSSFYDGYLGWGGRNIAEDISPIDAALSSAHSANRAELCKPDGITIEYSTNSGSSWTDYGASDNDKISLFSANQMPTFYLGKIGNTKNTSTALQLRVTMNATNMGIYTNLKKILINYTSNGASDNKVLVEYSNKGSETTWRTIGSYNINGWSSWNSICAVTGAFGGSNGQTNNKANIRLTFSFTSINSSYNSNPAVLNILLFGTTSWSYPSNFARNGHLYSWDVAGNAAFPAGIKANNFNGYTIAKSVPSDAKFTDTVYTHPTSAGNKHIPSGGTSGQILRWSADGTATWGNDNNTWRGVQNNLTSDATDQSLSAAQGKVLKGLVDGKAASSHTHNYATTSAAGLMSAEDKKKLAGIAEGANKTSVDSSLSSTSTNPVQNKVIYNAIQSNSGSISLTLKNGTTKPTSVSNKTVWVNTTVSLTDYVLSTKQPNNAKTGLLWIKTNDYGTELQIGKTIYHLYNAAVYDGNQWDSVEAWLYTTANSWVQFSTKLVPLDYQAVEYLQSNGDKTYIFTDLKPTSTAWGYEATLTVNNHFGTSDWVNMFGIRKRTASSSNPTHDNAKPYFAIDTYQNATLNGTLNLGNTPHAYSLGISAGVKATIKKHKDIITQPSGNSITVSSNMALDFYDGQSIGIFCNTGYVNTTSGAMTTSGNIASATLLYSLKFFDENDEIVGDFVPCYRKSDKVPGLWDRVKQKFYTNASTGTFLVGADIA